MRLRFTKMHGLGNDFMVVDGLTQPLPEDGPPLPEAELRRLGDRHFGVGFDQMLVVQPPRHEGVDFRYRIFNSDGSEVSQCGNGARCFARFVRDQGHTSKHEIRVETAEGGGDVERRLAEEAAVGVGARGEQRLEAREERRDAGRGVAGCTSYVATRGNASRKRPSM